MLFWYRANKKLFNIHTNLKQQSITPEIARFRIITTIVESGPFRTKPPKDRGRTVFPEIAIEDNAKATEKSTAGIKGFNGKKPGHRKKLASAFRFYNRYGVTTKRRVAGKDAVKGIMAKDHQLIADGTAFSICLPVLHMTIIYSNKDLMCKWIF